MKKTFSVKFNSKDIIKYLSDLEKKFKDLTPLMKTARVFLKHTVDENFETEGTATGDKWQEWSEKWKLRRTKLGRGQGKILTLDGHLRKSIQAKSGRDYALVGTNKEYAAIHNFGGAKYLKRNKNMPKREFMRLNDYKIDELYAELYLKAEDMAQEIKIKELRGGS